MVLSRLLLDSNLYLSVTRQLHWAPRPPNRTRCSPNCSCLSTRRSRHFLSLQRIKTIMNELYLRRDFFALTSTSVCPSLSLFLNLSLHRHRLFCLLYIAIKFLLQTDFTILETKQKCVPPGTYIPTYLVRNNLYEMTAFLHFLQPSDVRTHVMPTFGFSELQQRPRLLPLPQKHPIIIIIYLNQEVADAHFHSQSVSSVGGGVLVSAQQSLILILLLIQIILFLSLPLSLSLLVNFSLFLWPFHTSLPV